MPAANSLTTHLLSLSPQALSRATTHPFLPSAATRSLPKAQIQSWLAQDRLYATSYLTFVSTLLSQLRVQTSSPWLAASAPSPTDSDKTPTEAARPDAQQTLAWRIADALIDCLTNIRREIQLFERVARDEGWLGEIVGEGVRTEAPTRAYADVFAGATSGGKGTLVGLTALWATEECYLRAWRFAAGHLPTREGEGDVMQRVFIPNWSSAEFEGFVGRLRDLVDEMAEGVERDGWVWRECEDVWRRVLRVEEEFWPRSG